MTDIADQLRTWNYENRRRYKGRPYSTPPPAPRLMHDAADEIDRLRWALAAANAALDRAHQLDANE